MYYALSLPLERMWILKDHIMIAQIKLAVLAGKGTLDLPRCNILWEEPKPLGSDMLFGQPNVLNGLYNNACYYGNAWSAAVYKNIGSKNFGFIAMLRILYRPGSSILGGVCKYRAGNYS